MRERFSWKGHAGTALETVSGATVIDCDACRFRHIVPLPATVDLSQAPDAGADAALDAERYQLFERLWPECRRRLLAVGSRLGSFLQHGQQRGWSVRGVEPIARDGVQIGRAHV